MNELTVVDEQLITRFRKQKDHAEECLNTGVELLAEGWLTLYEISAEQTYLAEHETWEEFLAEFAKHVKDASRTLMCDRVRMVRRLKDIGWSDEEVLKALKSPTVAQEGLLKWGEWERAGGLHKLTNGTDRNVWITDEEGIPIENPTDAEILTHHLKNAIECGRGEGRKYISETVGEEQVYARLRDTSSFTAIFIVDEDLGKTFEFFCREAISNGARNYLERRFGTRFEE